MSDTQSGGTGGSIGYGHGPATGGAPAQLCVMLHGYGADGRDMIPAAVLLGQVFPRMFFAAPNAPEPCITDPECFQWYSPLEGRDLADLRVQQLAPRLNRYIDSLLARFELDDCARVFLGFSQGGGVAIEAALQRPQPCAALLGFTTAVRNKSGLLEQSRLLTQAGAHQQTRAKPPTLLVHGARDEAIPLASLHRSADSLRAAGLSVQTHVCGGIGHTMNDEGVLVAAEFLRAYL